MLTWGRAFTLHDHSFNLLKINGIALLITRCIQQINFIYLECYWLPRTIGSVWSGPRATKVIGFASKIFRYWKKSQLRNLRLWSLIYHSLFILFKFYSCLPHCCLYTFLPRGYRSSLLLVHIIPYGISLLHGEEGLPAQARSRNNEEECSLPIV